MADESATGSANLWSGLRFRAVDAKQLAELERWAKQLKETGDTGEARAAGRAIILLVDEVERLQKEGAEPPSAPPTLTRRPSFGRGRRRSEAPEEAGQAEEAGPAEETRVETAVVPDKRRERALERNVRRRRAHLRLALALAILLAMAFGTYSAAARIARPDLQPGGPAENDKIGGGERDELVFWLRGSRDTLDGTRWTLDGKDVTAATRLAGDRLVYDGTKTGDGEHTLEAKASGPFPGADATHEWRFAIDTTPPRIRMPNTEVEKGKPARILGRVEKGAELTAHGRAVSVRDDGRFTLAFPAVPTRPLQLVAVDGFGNRTVQSIRIKLAPRRPAHPLRAVHVTADAWRTPELRDGILRMIAERRINAVELDLKDEAGIVGFDADVEFGKKIGSVKGVYDLEDAVETLHERGVRVIGRLVAFRDPIHASAAWKAGRRAEVIQTPNGEPYAGYGGFTNFANPAVRRYNIDIARDAADKGVDDILYDYIRRPDGPLSSMVFPGLRGTPEKSIAEFLAETRRALPDDVHLGVSVFGVAATRPEEVAQDIPMMAREADYIAPMLYPSHWGPGEYNVANPNAQPYDIVRRSLRDFVKQTDGTGARVVPWLQDFSLGVTYGPAEVAAQTRAARDAGTPEWILWDPLVTYTADALARTAKTTSWPKKSKSSAPGQATATKVAQKRNGRAPNELGEIPVIMYHQIRADGGGDYDLTPAEFRAELALLFRQRYRPVRAIDLVRGKLDLPAGISPVVLTFDDSTKEQLAYGPGGKIKPDTAIGIMLDFARKHPGFTPAGTFYVNREPFAGVAEGSEMLRWLVENGFELGNHTHDHIPFNQKDAAGVQQALVLGKRLIRQAAPNAQVRTMALPLGVEPKPARLAVAGQWGGESYRHEGVLLVGAGPSPSPFSKKFDPAGIPRMRTGPWKGEDDFASGFWLRILQQNPERRYVSDGDPTKITFPRRLSGELAPEHRAKANPS